MKEKLKMVLPILVMIAMLAAFLLPDKLEEMACHDFGEPLFTHALPPVRSWWKKARRRMKPAA